MQYFYSNLQKHFSVFVYHIILGIVVCGLVTKVHLHQQYFKDLKNIVKNPNNLLLDKWKSKLLHCIIAINISGQKNPQIEENRSKRQDPCSGMRFRLDQEIKRLLFFT